MLFLLIALQFHDFPFTSRVIEPLAKKPIFYTDEMNVRLFGIHKFHIFDSEKYFHIFETLTSLGIFSPNEFSIPPINETFADELLQLVHTKQYLDGCLQNATCIASVAEFPPLQFLPVSVLQSKIIFPMKVHVLSTIAATEAALHYNYSISLGGGLHHAHANMGSGWCFFDDIGISIKYWKCIKKAFQKVLIIDTDAHQGNGYQHDKINQVLACGENDSMNDIFVVDLFNRAIYPHDSIAKRAINVKVELRSGTEDKYYISSLRKALNIVVKKFQPDIIFFVSGSDILSYVFSEEKSLTSVRRGDPLGAMNISPKGLLQRDYIIFDYAINKFKAPIVMVLAGGYSRSSAHVIANSIMHLKHFLFESHH